MLFEKLISHKTPKPWQNSLLVNKQHFREEKSCFSSNENILEKFHNTTFPLLTNRPEILAKTRRATVCIPRTGIWYHQRTEANICLVKEPTAGDTTGIIVGLGNDKVCPGHILRLLYCFWGERMVLFLWRTCFVSDAYCKTLIVMRNIACKFVNFRPILIAYF